MATSLPWSFCWAGGRGERGVAMSSLRLRAIAATPRWQKTNRSEWPWSPSRHRPYVLFAAAASGSTLCVGCTPCCASSVPRAPRSVAYNYSSVSLPEHLSSGFFTTNYYNIRSLLIEPNCQILNNSLKIVACEKRTILTADTNSYPINLRIFSESYKRSHNWDCEVKMNSLIGHYQ